MTKSVLHMKVVTSLLLAFVGNVSATTFTNVPSGANTGSPFVSFGNAPNPSGDSPKVGQVFSLQTDSTLSSFSFYALGNTTSAASLQLNVAQWNPDTNAKNQAINLVGANLLTTSNFVGNFNAAGGFTTINFDNLGLNLESDTKYIAYLSSTDLTLSGIQLSRTQTTADVTGFGLGNAFLSNIPNNGWQLPFNGNGFLSLQYTAVTADVPNPSAVPVPAALPLMASALGIFGIARRRNKSKLA